MGRFCASNQPLWGPVDVAAFCYSATAARKRIDNRLPVGLLSNALRIGEVVVAAEKLLGARFNLLQGYRCAELNLAVYGSPGSLHVAGLAVDGAFVGVPLLVACQRLAESDLPLVEIEAKQTQLHLAYGDPRKRRLLRQFEAFGPVVAVSGFLADGVRG